MHNFKPINPDDTLFQDDDMIEPPSPRASHAWLVTFTDLVALMLTFFVMIYSMSNVKIGNWNEMSDTMSRSLNPDQKVTTSKPTVRYNIADTLIRRAINLDYLYAVIEQSIEHEAMLKGSKIVMQDDHLVITLPGGAFFRKNQAQLTQRGKDGLFVLGGVLRNISNRVGVNGYTGGAVPTDSGYRSTWEFSLARAVVAANVLRRAGLSDGVNAFGLGDSRYRGSGRVPGAQTLADRIEVVIYASKSSSL